MSDFVDGLRQAATAALFPTEGELKVPGLSDPVGIFRDALGVPSIRARSLDDLWFAQGVFTAGERLFQLDLALRAANGRLSEVFSERTLAEDRFARTVGFHRAGARQAASWDAESRAMHARFREGVFAWIEAMTAQPIEYTLLDVVPELPSDEAAWAAVFVYVAWGLSGNWDAELLRAWIHDRLGPEGVAMLMPPLPKDPPAVAAGALHGSIFDATPRSGGRGSNDWVVAGSRTKSGKPLLANDPHLLVQQPSPWLAMHLSAPGYEASGVAFTFSPGVILGATPHHAWGVTNVSGDVQDLYVERLNEERTAALYEEAWEPLTIHREEIVIRGAGEPHVVEVRETRHGPILEHHLVGVLSPDVVPIPTTETYALRWTGLDRSVTPSLPLRLARATDFDSFRDAALRVECPGQNFVYADVDGAIGYACTGLYPMRRVGDGTVPVPGWTAEHDWDGWIPLEELPWAADPKRGFLATANNRTHDDAYPHLIGRDFHTAFRARRIVELLRARDDHDVESMRAIQLDTVSLPACETLPLLLARAGEGATEAERAALKLLGEWDGDMRVDSAAAAVFNVWCRHIARRVLQPKLGQELFAAYHAWRETFQCQALPRMLQEPDGWIENGLIPEALAEALAELSEALGEDLGAWRWGAIHRLRLAHPLASIPGLEGLFVAADVEFGGDEQTVSQGGFDGRDGYQVAVHPSWRIVHDLAHPDRSVGVLPTGISGNPASPHWNDQVGVYIDGARQGPPLRAGVPGTESLRLIPR